MCLFISEDVVMDYSLDEKFTPRDLTPEEKTFLNALVTYTMPLEKSLFFQIADLQRHTKLEFSMNGGRFKGSESPGRDVLEKELTELAKMLEEAAPDLEKAGFKIDLDSNAGTVSGTNIQGSSETPREMGPQMQKKVYPNDPCPCGSGKKYKKCCGRDESIRLRSNQE